jgi:hypothetical protein
VVVRTPFTALASLLASSLACDASSADSFAAADCPSLAGVAADPGSFATPPPALTDTGLYCDVGQLALAPGIDGYVPAYEGWSDGAEKTRWIQLPSGSKIDTSDPDNWSFPVGTRLWKEFKYIGKRVETRFITRFGAGPDDFLYAAYRWNADETAAVLVPDGGVADVAPIAADPGAPLHDIPSAGACKSCHGGLPAHVLGLSAIQASHEAGGLSLAALVVQDRVTVAPAFTDAVPGDPVEQAALGYLNANCGHCHNDTPTGVTYPRFVLRIRVGDTSAAMTHVHATAVNVLHTWLGAPAEVGRYRVRGGNAEDSELYFRTGVRVPGQQMPPIGTEVPDARGHALLKQWIDRLPPPE